MFSTVLCFSFFLGYSQTTNFTAEEKEWLKSHPQIHFGYEPNWPPFEIYENGEYKGIIGDYVKILERETGIDFVPIPNITWEKAIAGLKSGQIDFTVCAGITDERKQYLNFTKPYISSPMVIITNLDAPFIDELADLNGKTVSLPKGYYTAELISKDYPKIKIKYEEGYESSLKSVSLGQSDAFVGNLVVGSYYIKHSGFTNLKIAAPANYEKAHIGLAARKDWPELISISQKVFDNISFQEKNAILQKWIELKHEHSVNYDGIKSYVIYGLLILVVVFIVIIFWTKSLKKEIVKRKEIEKQLEATIIDVNKKSEERKVLLQEIHHRVKNNLQIIISLLRLQKENSDNKLQEKLDEAINRVSAISLVHEKIYHSDNLAKINMNDYVHNLANDIITSFTINNKPSLSVQTNFHDLDVKSLVPMALILNELITNSLKHGLKDFENGKIEINIFVHNNKISMSYSDNGKWIENSSKASFGISLIETFTEQLDGSFSRTVENGTTYNFEFTV